jgi:hypothetical protein
MYKKVLSAAFRRLSFFVSKNKSHTPLAK